MKNCFLVVLFLISTVCGILAQTAGDFPENEEKKERKELKFIGYYFMRSELSNMAPTAVYFKGQVVGRLFGGNTTKTSSAVSRFSEQRFMPILAYSPRLFDGWATIRANFEIDWTIGDNNYGAGGNNGSAFAGDYVNLQTQNLFIELHPQKNLYVNAGLTRLFDNINVPAYTFTSTLIYTGYRLAFFGSDAAGVAMHYFPKPNQKIKAGIYQLYENNIEQNDDVVFYELDYEYDLDIVNSVGLSLWYLKDDGNGEGGVSIYGQGLNCGLSDYNGVFNFNIGNESYNADIFWLGTHFHGNPLLNQGRFGYGGFGVMNFGKVDTYNDPSNILRTIDILGFAGNLRLAFKYGKNANDHVSLDGVFTTGDGNNVSDNKYTGILTGNNWTAPGAVFFSHGLYLLLPHGNVVNRFTGAVTDIQNIGYGLAAGVLSGSYDIVPNKFRAKAAIGAGIAPKTASYTYEDANNNPVTIRGGHNIGTEMNFNLTYTPKVFMDIELHAAYLWLGDFFETPAVNGWESGYQVPMDFRPDDAWTIFATLKWIMF